MISKKFCDNFHCLCLSFRLLFHLSPSRAAKQNPVRNQVYCLFLYLSLDNIFFILSLKVNVLQLS